MLCETSRKGLLCWDVSGLGGQATRNEGSEFKDPSGSVRGLRSMEGKSFLILVLATMVGPAVGVGLFVLIQLL